MKPEIILIAAMDKEHAIGKGGDIPWRGKLPADMKHFQELTMGGVVLMGRKTWESIPEKFRPLSGRANMVLTHDRQFQAPGAYVVHDSHLAITRAGGNRVYVIGGAEIYRQYLPIADSLELTLVDTITHGDTFFPFFSEPDWTFTETLHSADDKNHYSYTFRRYIRTK